MVPHLITALNGPINELEQRVLESLPAIERWLRLEWMEHTPPFYASVDLRNAGFKLAPVETNLFPAGYNHLTEAMLPLAVQAAMAAIEKICPEAKNLLLIPGRATGNSFYLTHLARLVQVFTQAGLNVRLGSTDPAVTEPQELRLPRGDTLLIEPLQRNRGRVGLKHFDPCTILLNHDLLDGVPRVLEHVHEQYLLPPLHAGWATRRKSNHLRAYEELARKFAKLLGMDPWLLTPMWSPCGEVDFATGEGADQLQAHADALLLKVRRKYKEYGINERPFVIVKADDGSDGQGILTVRDARELADFASRGGEALGLTGERARARHGVILQEGVPTYERVNDAVAEPVVMLMDRYVVGGYYRVNAERAFDESLCSPSTTYVPLAFAESGHITKLSEKPGASVPNRFYMYGVVARLALVAAAYELEATDPEAESYD